MDFAAAVARLDAEADIRLGDSLFYFTGGLATVTPVKGFFSDPSDLTIRGLDAPIDNVAARIVLEISRDIVAQPSKNDRIRSDNKLVAGRVWRPSSWRPVKTGRYWFIGLEKVGTV